MNTTQNEILTEINNVLHKYNAAFFVDDEDCLALKLLSDDEDEIVDTPIAITPDGELKIYDK